VTQHFVVAKLCRRKAERLTPTHYVYISLYYHVIRRATVILRDCLVIAHVLELPCGEASFKLGELVRGPGVDHELRLKSMPWDLTLSSLAWAEESLWIIPLGFLT
jgi:hypothetical protein